MDSCYLRGQNIKCLRIPEEVLDMVHENKVIDKPINKTRGTKHNLSRGSSRGGKDQSTRGRGGRGRGTRGGRGGSESKVEKEEDKKDENKKIARGRGGRGSRGRGTPQK